MSYIEKANNSLDKNNDQYKKRSSKTALNQLFFNFILSA